MPTDSVNRHFEFTYLNPSIALGDTFIFRQAIFALRLQVLHMENSPDAASARK